MSILLISFVAILICFMAGGAFFRQRFPSRPPDLAAFNNAKTRRLTGDERQAVEGYLKRNALRVIASEDAAVTPAAPILNERSNRVVCVNMAITRYRLTTDAAWGWRYYLDATEVHLPAFLEQYISNDNAIELIQTDTVWLVISLNQHSLFEYEEIGEEQELNFENSPTQASFRDEGGEKLELLYVRRENLEEYWYRHPHGVREAILVGLSFLCYFLSLVGPVFLLQWLIFFGCLVLALGLWGIFGRPGRTMRREIHCLTGTPRRWGLFADNDRDRLNSVSLGVIDLTYPLHWQPWLRYELGYHTDIDTYLDHRVVRQGRFLSLQNEIQRFPLQRWIRSAIISVSALLIVVMMLIWVPLDMPMKLTLAWLKGGQTIETSSVEQLLKAEPQVGDTLKIHGNGMCYISASGLVNLYKNSPFMPFDCSRIVWNNTRPMPLPKSDVTVRARALVDEITRQLHPQLPPDSHINPRLATVIHNSGMILMDNFDGLVLKTAALCTLKQECIRLKNALVNLGNSKNWDTLVRRARAGRLNGVNVLLRPVSAESLENLVNTSVAPFFVHETTQAVQKLNNSAPGGFLLIGENGNTLVNHPFPTRMLFDYPPPQQWQEFLRLARMLTHTPFHIEGVVTRLQTDANGTQHITLNTLPEGLSFSRLAGTCLLMLAMLVCCIINAVLAVRRYLRYCLRMEAIHNYYHQQFNPPLLALPSKNHRS